MKQKWYRVINTDKIIVQFGVDQRNHASVEWDKQDHSSKMVICHTAWPFLSQMMTVINEMILCNGQTASPNEFMAILNDLGYERVSHCEMCGELYPHSKWGKGSSMDYCTVHCWAESQVKPVSTCPECGDKFQGADGEFCSYACAGAHDEYEQYIEEASDASS